MLAYIKTQGGQDPRNLLRPLDSTAAVFAAVVSPLRTEAVDRHPPGLVTVDEVDRLPGVQPH